jgi:leucyl aminopeptidase (aminopeptidase T)
MKSVDAWQDAKNALTCVYEAKKGESVTIFCDDVKTNVGEAFAAGALRLGLRTHVIHLKTGNNIFRKEVSPDIVKILVKQEPDIYINLLRGIREETPFRMKFTRMEMEKHRARLAHCPGVTLDMLTEGALALTIEEHKQMQTFAHSLMEKLSQATKVEITNPAGTEVSLSVEERPFITDTIIDWETMKWTNLPTGEVYVAPVENSLEGRFVCDMAVGGIEPLKTSIELSVKSGKVQGISFADTQVLSEVKDSLNTDGWSSVVGEFAFGINPKARFVEEFLESEKMLGTVHIAFGGNMDMPGGKNCSGNHMDLLISKPTVRVFCRDGSSTAVLSDGMFEH